MTPTTWMVWVTCAVDGIDHAVTDENMSTGVNAGRGHYTAVCGDSVVPAALTAPPGQACSRCAAVLRHPTCNPPEERPDARRRYGAHRRHGLRARVLSLLPSRGPDARRKSA